jgi:prevent-host-death family protein
MATQLWLPRVLLSDNIKLNANLATTLESDMLDLAEDIQSLSTFKRDTARLAEQLRKTGRPVVLTVNGKAEMVVQDAAAYQRLVELAEQAEMLAFLQKGKAEIDAGRTKPALEALDMLAKKYKLTGKKK